MLRHPGHHVWDAWFHTAGDIVHAYYLTIPEEVPPHTLWHIGHATSRDLIHWEIQPLALEYGAKDEWDNCLATGSVARVGERYVMAYTSHHRAQTGLAWSDNLYIWHKDRENPITSLDSTRYEPIGTGQRKMAHWRDPFLLQHEGTWYQFTCASQAGRGTIGVATSPDLKTWTIRPPLELEAFCEEYECPQIYCRGGRYYLVFSTASEFIYPESLARLGDSPAWTTYVMIADHLFGPYRLAPQARIFPSTFDQPPYACQIATLRDQDYCLGIHFTANNSAYLGAPHPVKATEQGFELIS